MKFRNSDIRRKATRAGTFSNLFFLMMGMSLMALATVWKPGLVPFAPGVRSAKEPAKDLPAVQTPSAHPQNPWGELEYTRFALAQPGDYLPDSTNRLPTARWYFEKSTLDQVAAIFKSLDVSNEIRELLFDTSHWYRTDDGVVVNPTSEILIGLGRPARQRLYSILAGSPVNFLQLHPFRFRADGGAEWFAQSRLPADKLRLVQSLTYTNGGGALCLVDIDVLQEKLTPDEFHHLFKSLYSEQSLLLSLRVSASADLEPLARYWGRGGREKDVLALLKSVARLPGGGSVNVEHLLPPFARLRLYTYPEANTNAPVSGGDCFWTALNFFKSTSEIQLSNMTSSLEFLFRDYSPTLEAPRYGDVFLFFENQKPAHACVYIADDIVFTKNGANYHQPWTLMKMSDMMPRYTTERPMSAIVLRSKNS